VPLALSAALDGLQHLSQRDGVWEAICAELHVALRERIGREARPSAAALNRQSVKSPEKGSDSSSTKICRRFPWLELIWADGGYNAWQVDAALAKVPRLRMEIVKRSDDRKGFLIYRAAGWSSVPSPG